MSPGRQRLAIVLGLGLFFATALYAVLDKEAVLAEGELVLLELAPVDPRSLIQGDYMRLNYALHLEIGGEGWRTDDGIVIVRLDARSVATLVGRDEGQALGPDERRLRYRRRSGRLQVGPEAFYFQEGHAVHYEGAKYGALRVSDQGEVVLVGLRGADLAPCGPPSPGS